MKMRTEFNVMSPGLYGTKYNFVQITCVVLVRSEWFQVFGTGFFDESHLSSYGLLQPRWKALRTVRNNPPEHDLSVVRHSFDELQHPQYAPRP